MYTDHDRDEVTLFKNLIRLRPIGIHKHFRLIALHVALNSAHDATKYSLNDIRTKLDTLYSMEDLDHQALQMDDKDDSDSDVGENEQVSLKDFELPYHEYMTIIEDHARDDKSSPSRSRDQSPTQTESTKQELQSDEEVKEAPKKVRKRSTAASSPTTKKKRASIPGTPTKEEERSESESVKPRKRAAPSRKSTRKK